MSWHRPNAPSGRITSPFGKRGPIPGAPNASRDHLGVDLRSGTSDVSSDIYAAAAGKVRRIYKTPLGAWVLELDHGGGVWTRYAHMQRTGIAVAAGARVSGGQRVAAASNSGAPTVHLHFEVLVDGRQVDPVPYLRARGIDLTTTTVSRPGASTGQISSPTIPGRPAPLTPVQEDDMLLIRHPDGPVMLVIGGIGSPVAGPDYAAYQRAGIPVVGVSREGYQLATDHYLKR
ncbi:M23 family metallopeptidase [Oerskovia jenensis]|uniref:M23 family metallopeptidase n=1 Tax=Oerskovia jenensis TaxID=162169 RepID=UPI0036DA175A